MAYLLQNNRKHLSAGNMISLISEGFNSITDYRKNVDTRKISVHDASMSAFAMLHLKYPSLLSFEREKSEPSVRHNLKHLYHVKNRAPCDTSMREILDPQDPADFKKPYKLLLSEVQRAGLLKSFEFRIGSLKNHYLLAIDGTGIFHTSNNKKPCQECCTKNKGKTNEAHYHQMMAACIVHPEQKTVLPLAPEAIVLQDGASKNDCEKTAIKRLFSTIKKNHPRLKFVILLDGLYADNPTTSLIKDYGWHYIIVAKAGNHTSLVEAMDSADKEGKVRRIERTNDEVNIKQWYRYANNLSLNKSACAEHVNVLDFVEIDKKDKRHTWCWITDLKLNEMTVEAIMKGGRCRWHIENQTFNTLKNQGYNLEHNYGHGEKHLTTNLAYLTVLAFLVDQIQELCCPQFQKALKGRSKGTRIALWKWIQNYFLNWLIKTWQGLFYTIINGAGEAKIIPFDTS
jgi:hypothetical protein